jgi:hypothetical protein
MTLFREVLEDLWSMFVADARLSLGVLLIVGLAWLAGFYGATLTGLAVLTFGLPLLLAGFLLTVGRSGR